MRRLRDPMHKVFLRGGASSSNSAANRISPFKAVPPVRLTFGTNANCPAEEGSNTKPKLVWKNEIEQSWREENQMNVAAEPGAGIGADVSARSASRFYQRSVFRGNLNNYLISSSYFPDIFLAGAGVTEAAATGSGESSEEIDVATYDPQEDIKRVITVLSAILSTGKHGQKVALRVKTRFERFLNLKSPAPTSASVMLRDVEIALTKGAAQAPPGSVFSTQFLKVCATKLQLFRQ